jgi:hypothetical protein
VDKKRNKLKEYEEAVASKLDAKKAEITELKANQTKELAALQRAIDEQREKVCPFLLIPYCTHFFFDRLLRTLLK